MSAPYHRPGCVSAPFCKCAEEEIALLRAQVETLNAEAEEQFDRASRASAATGADEVTAICQRWTAQVEHMRAGIVALANRWSEPSRHARGTYFACASELLAEWDRLAFEAPPSPPSPELGASEEEIASALADALSAIDEAYAATGYARVAKTSRERMRIEGIVRRLRAEAGGGTK